MRGLERIGNVNSDVFSTVVVVWTSALLLVGLAGAFLGELTPRAPSSRRLAPGSEPTHYKKAA